MKSEDILNVFHDHPGTDRTYLEAHLTRFLNTYRRFDSGWDRNRGMRMLDIGAHWLHQSVVFRLGGYEVIAADVPVTMELESVRQLAAALDIELLAYDDLSAAGCLSAVPSDSINVILLAEIIEHITFNPVEMWKEIYRVTAPGGRIVITTPNYYWAGGRAWNWKRFLTGHGGGIPTTEIVSLHTMGHHWKEYSLRELLHYVCLLSPDFNCVRMEYTSDYPEKSSAFQRRCKWFREGLHLEIELMEKAHGIIAEPGW
jgi:2-polyprenyl-6-hydroxyphenyl methylase/3-demethylubiquinone-9 3-methyltransferase